MANFEKKDDSFVCANCGNFVAPLGYSSRDHCNKCLCSLHVDIVPGDRQNDCKGLLVPVAIETNTKKGYVIVYKCQKCGKLHKNKTATDDDFEKILEIMKNQFWLQFCWYIEEDIIKLQIFIKSFLFCNVNFIQKIQNKWNNKYSQKKVSRTAHLLKQAMICLHFYFVHFLLFYSKNFIF